MRTLLEQFSRARSWYTTELEVVIGLLKLEQGFHRRQIENSVDRTGVKAAVSERLLDVFDRRGPIGFVQPTIHARDEIFGEPFCPYHASAPFQRFGFSSRGRASLCGWQERRWQ